MIMNFVNQFLCSHHNILFYEITIFIAVPSYFTRIHPPCSNRTDKQQRTFTLITKYSIFQYLFFLFLTVCEGTTIRTIVCLYRNRANKSEGVIIIYYPCRMYIYLGNEIHAPPSKRRERLVEWYLDNNSSSVDKISHLADTSLLMKGYDTRQTNLIFRASETLSGQSCHKLCKRGDEICQRVNS